MKHMKITLIAAALACTGISITSKAQAQERELNWDTFAKVRDYADRKDSDKHYLSIPWTDTVFDGMVQGQKEDKPVLLWLYFGDGRGNC